MRRTKKRNERRRRQEEMERVRTEKRERTETIRFGGFSPETIEILVSIKKELEKDDR